MGTHRSLKSDATDFMVSYFNGFVEFFSDHSNWSMSLRDSPNFFRKCISYDKMQLVLINEQKDQCFRLNLDSSNCSIPENKVYSSANFNSLPQTVFKQFGRPAIHDLQIQEFSLDLATLFEEASGTVVYHSIDEQPPTNRISVFL